MYKKYRDRGFEILDFQCNQFADQTPNPDEEISNFCTLKFGTELPQYEKIDVNGENATELFKYLKSKKTYNSNNAAGCLEDYHKVVWQRMLTVLHQSRFSALFYIQWK